MKKLTQMLRIVFAGLLLLGSARSAFAEDLLINGAGASFPYPIYSKWFDDFYKANPKYKFNYQAIGSGGGQRQVMAGTVDFGASDGPMSDENLKNAPDTILHIPTVLGAVVATYNLPEIKESLKLTPDALAGIFLGKITNWNDPAIQSVNPGVQLPNRQIVVVHRSDGSGTSYIFTDYLSKVSKAWGDKVGSGTSVSWPIGLGAKGNEGVSGLVKQTPYSVGYVEYIYAIQNKLGFAQLKNSSGNFITPSIESVSAAANVAMPADFRVSITNSSASNAYPISGFTWLLIYQHPKDKVKGKAIVEFLNWMLDEGQNSAAKLGYAPLPKSVREMVRKAITKVQV